MDSISQDQINQILARFALQYGADVAEVAFEVPQKGDANGEPHLQVGVLTETAKSRIESEFEGFEVRVRIVEELRPLDGRSLTNPFVSLTRKDTSMKKFVRASLGSLEWRVSDVIKLVVYLSPVIAAIIICLHFNLRY